LFSTFFSLAARLAKISDILQTSDLFTQVCCISQACLKTK
jgi:hypothetical protein